VTDPMIEKFARYTHLEKEYGHLPGMSDRLQAELFGLTEPELLELRAGLDAGVLDAATGLLADPEFAARVDRLPFQSGQTIVAVGDSMTDDQQSWLSIVRDLLALRRSAETIAVVNNGISGYTTAMALRRTVPALAYRRPDWVLCLLGGNDVTRVGPEPNQTLVSIGETERNLRAIRSVGAAVTSAKWVWLTPVPVDEARVAAFMPFQRGLSSWRNDDVVAVAELMTTFDDPVVDLRAVFGVPPKPELQGEDGVHPSLAGQAAIARAFVEALT
jgi:acyl-CoA thioesterase I